jgi:hypothetical protein
MGMLGRLSTTNTSLTGEHLTDLLTIRSDLPVEALSFWMGRNLNRFRLQV